MELTAPCVRVVRTKLTPHPPPPCAVSLGHEGPYISAPSEFSLITSFPSLGGLGNSGLSYSNSSV